MCSGEPRNISTTSQLRAQETPLYLDQSDWQMKGGRLECKLTPTHSDRSRKCIQISFSCFSKDLRTKSLFLCHCSSSQKEESTDVRAQEPDMRFRHGLHHQRHANRGQSDAAQRHGVATPL